MTGDSPINISAGRNRENGFTLIELLVTLTIASLLIAVAAPRVTDSIRYARLKTAADGLSVALRDTRSSAMRQAAQMTVTVDPTENSYTAAGKATFLAKGEHISFESFDRTNSTGSVPTIIVFYPDGSATGGSISISAGPNRIRVNIDWLTGRILVGN